MIAIRHNLDDELLETAAVQAETIARLQGLVRGLAARVAAQSAVLSLRAERAPVDVDATLGAASLATLRGIYASIEEGLRLGVRVYLTVDGQTLGPIRVGGPDPDEPHR